MCRPRDTIHSQRALLNPEAFQAVLEQKNGASSPSARFSSIFSNANGDEKGVSQPEEMNLSEAEPEISTVKPKQQQQQQQQPKPKIEEIVHKNEDNSLVSLMKHRHHPHHHPEEEIVFGGSSSSDSSFVMEEENDVAHQVLDQIHVRIRSEQNRARERVGHLQRVRELNAARRQRLMALRNNGITSNKNKTTATGAGSEKSSTPSTANNQLVQQHQETSLSKVDSGMRTKLLEQIYTLQDQLKAKTMECNELRHELMQMEKRNHAQQKEDLKREHTAHWQHTGEPFNPFPSMVNTAAQALPHMRFLNSVAHVSSTTTTTTTEEHHHEEGQIHQDPVTASEKRGTFVVPGEIRMASACRTTTTTTVTQQLQQQQHHHHLARGPPHYLGAAGWTYSCSSSSMMMGMMPFSHHSFKASPAMLIRRQFLGFYF